MVRGVGIDLVEIPWIREHVVRPAFVRKVCSPAESEACRRAADPAVRFAEHFALKEAVMKALGAGIRQGLWFRQIEVRFGAAQPLDFALERRALERFRDCRAAWIRGRIAVEGETVTAVVLVG